MRTKTNTIERHSVMKKLALLLVVVFAVVANASAVNVREHGVKGDGKADDTAAVQALLDKKTSELFFPDGVYLLGTLKVPGDTTIRFAPKAKYKINPAKLKEFQINPKVKAKRAIILSGDNITLDGLDFDFMTASGKELGVKDLKSIIYGDGISNLRVTRLRAIRKTLTGMPGSHPYLKERGFNASFLERKMRVIELENCHDIEVDRCEVAKVGFLLMAQFCENVSVHENRAQWAASITRFNYGRGLRHYANWSRNVVFQCVWWGGNCGIPDKRSNVVRPDLKPGDKGFDIQTAGVYDVSVQNNYAEYGVTLAWGAKARNVLIDGNIARFMDDMAYDCEGDENIIISNNISINSAVAGIGCYFWTDKVQITGNLIMVLDEGDDRYKGMFVRLHSGGKMGPDKVGTGKAFVSGNLFVSEVISKKHQGDTLNRMIQVEDCRDITISGNKFINGWIRTAPWCRSGKVTIMNNEFDNRLASNSPAIRIDSNGTEAIIRNNIIRLVQGAESKPGFKDAAIHILASSGKRMIIEGNIIEGWLNSISCKPKKPKAAPAKYIIKNNSITGNINWLGLPGRFQTYVRNNLNIDTLRQVKAIFVPEKDFKDEKYKM